MWIQQVAADAAAYTHRTVPNGSVELVCRVGSVPELIGPRAGPKVRVLAPGTTVVGVRFRPGAAPPALGVSALELLDLEVGSEELWGRSAVALGERVAAAATPRQAVALLEQQIAGRLGEGEGPDPVVAEAVRRLMPWQNGDVGALASSLFISERHLRRRLRFATGLSPKVLHRLLRFQGFLALTQLALAQGRAPADDGLALLAAEVGYADQSHLTRESLRLTGLTPHAFLRAAEEQCGPEHDHAATFRPLLRSRA